MEFDKFLELSAPHHNGQVVGLYHFGPIYENDPCDNGLFLVTYDTDGNKTSIFLEREQLIQLRDLLSEGINALEKR